MFSAILIILSMIFLDLGKTRGFQNRPITKLLYFYFCAVFVALMILGAKHVESPFIEYGQILTINYFLFFLIVIPFISVVENKLSFLKNNEK
jgi:ubiquinol-cytochrome c reductase cytochrome b subunit